MPLYLPSRSEKSWNEREHMRPCIEEIVKNVFEKYGILDGKEEGKIILELGCGNGFLWLCLPQEIKRNAKYVQVDLEMSACKKAKKNTRGEVICANAFQLANLFEENNFDTVIAMNFFTSFPPEIYEKEVCIITEPCFSENNSKNGKINLYACVLSQAKK